MPAESPAPGAAGYSVDCVQYADGCIAWRLWDDATDQVIGQYTTEAAALVFAGAQVPPIVAGLNLSALGAL